MSSSPRTRLYRAVRLLPEAVRIGPAAEPPPSEEDRGSDVPAAPPRTLALELQYQARIESLEREVAALTKRNDALEAAKTEAEEALAAGLAQREKTYRAERDKILAAARAEGLEAGRKAGHAEGTTKAEKEVAERYRRRFDEALTLLSKIHDALKVSFSDLEEAQAPRLVRLWEVTLARLLAREVSLQESPVIPLLRQVLLRTSDRERIIVYLHPQDLKHVDTAREVLGDILRGTNHLDFRGDDHVDRGSCLVETNLGVYDARFRTQLASLAREIDTVLSGGSKDRSGMAALLGGGGDEA
ncbi:flagellar assembly protein FliH [Aminithiophilus ramosus]|uniref:Flagellar assembly protein FliH n=2 Tax=Synergistales TaxID=649776 RepID=A0A9Q7AE35_9BACT|nr:FliH/SctL family protein [Aminithiophilus ramosus]QTX31669.1 flagellar assembly protein FliH [Aminithiophilus ramosus]QVL35476.1 flagellar assembly protein FliH [Synergistota bacterium]